MPQSREKPGAPVGARFRRRKLRTPGYLWPEAVTRYLAESTDKKSTADDRHHLRKLDPYLRCLSLDAIDMAALQGFIRERKLADGVSNAGQPGPRDRPANAESCAPGLALAQQRSPDPDAQGTTPASAVPSA